jgi:hypothetical protein
MHRLTRLLQLAVTRWALLALVIVAAAGLGLVSTGANAQDPTSTSDAGNALSETIPPCPPPGPYDGKAPSPDGKEPQCLDMSRVEPRADAPIIPPPSASGGSVLGARYHYIGTQTGYSSLNRGVSAGRQVTDAGLAHDDVVYDTMHVVRGANWLEVGWFEFGSDFGGGRGVFTCCPWQTHSEYAVSPGMTVYFRITQLSTGSATWIGQIFWNGQWRWIRTLNLGAGGADRTDVVVEIHTNDAVHPWLDDTWTNCAWVLWSTGIPTTTLHDAPYEIYYQSRYYQWYAYTT